MTDGTDKFAVATIAITNLLIVMVVIGYSLLQVINKSMNHRIPTMCFSLSLDSG